MAALGTRILLASLFIAALVAGHASALAQTSITRSGPDASHAPIVIGSRVDFVLVEGGAVIDAGPDGLAINSPATGGGIGTPGPEDPPLPSLGLTVDGSTVNGSIVSQSFVSASSAFRPAVRIDNSVIAGRLENDGIINTFVGGENPDGSADISAVDIRNSHIGGGIFNGGDIVAAENIGGTGLSVTGGIVQGGLTNSGLISGTFEGVELAADNFSGGVVNTGTISGGGRFGFVAPGLVIGGNIFSGGLINRGTIGGVRIQSTVFNGRLLNAGAVENDSPGGSSIAIAPGMLNGNIYNAGNGTVTGNTALSVDGVVNGTLRNAGLLQGVTQESSDGESLPGIGIRLGPDGSIAGGIVNTGRILGDAAAIDLTAATRPTMIANQGGIIRGDILMAQSAPVADKLLAQGGLIAGQIRGDAADTLLANPGAGGMVIEGSISGFGNIAVNAGRTLVEGHIYSPGFLGLGLVAGVPATLALGAGQISWVGSLAIYGDGTLAIDVTAAGESGQIVAKTAYVRGSLELDLLPGTYAATTTYDDVVTAPGLGTTRRTTFKSVTTNVPGYTATVTYDNGTADVTLTRTGAPSVAAVGALAGPATSQAATAARSRLGRDLGPREGSLTASRAAGDTGANRSRDPARHEASRGNGSTGSADHAGGSRGGNGGGRGRG